MKPNLQLKCLIPLVAICFLASNPMEAQCEIFKSEMKDVTDYLAQVGHLTDSLQTFSEAAAYGDRFDTARKNVRKVELLMGLALNSADEAVTLASDIQYYSEICGIDEVKSYAIDLESNTLDSREFSQEAYTNAKKALRAKNLGNIRYYMRKSQEASLKARNSAEVATYAAFMTHSKCTHSATQTVGIDPQ